MERYLKYGFVLGVLLLIAAFTQRASIREIWLEMQKPDVEAVGFEEETKVAESLSHGVAESGTEEAAEEIVIENPEPDVETQRLNDSVTPQLPTEYNLAIPFTSQAPYGVWDAVHEETCEEASVLMVAAYFDGQPVGSLSAESVEEELQRIMKFEDSLFGYHEDTTASETALVLENYENLTTELVLNPTADQLKEQIAAGYPIIIPAAGQQLGNPYFTAPGPRYHMLVIKGYTEEGFITNDPGTRHGEDYFYATETLLSAIHDWNGGEVELGEAVVIIVKP